MGKIDRADLDGQAEAIKTALDTDKKRTMAAMDVAHAERMAKLDGVIGQQHEKLKQSELSALFNSLSAVKEARAKFKAMESEAPATVYMPLCMGLKRFVDKYGKEALPESLQKVDDVLRPAYPKYYQN